MDWNIGYLEFGGLPAVQFHAGGGGVKKFIFFFGGVTKFVGLLTGTLLDLFRLNPRHWGAFLYAAAVPHKHCLFNAKLNSKLDSL